MSCLLSLYPEDAKEKAEGKVGSVSRQGTMGAEQATREPECSEGEWIGQPVDGQTPSATFADETQGAGKGKDNQIS
jgi:hypothetical protein